MTRELFLNTTKPGKDHACPQGRGSRLRFDPLTGTTRRQGDRPTPRRSQGQARRSSGKTARPPPPEGRGQKRAGGGGCPDGRDEEGGRGVGVLGGQGTRLHARLGRGDRGERWHLRRDLEGGGHQKPGRGTAAQRPRHTRATWSRTRQHGGGGAGGAARGGRPGRPPSTAGCVLRALQGPPGGSEQGPAWTSLPKAPRLPCGVRGTGAQQEGRRGRQARQGRGPGCGAEAPSMWSPERNRGVRRGGSRAEPPEGAGHGAGESAGGFGAMRAADPTTETAFKNRRTFLNSYSPVCVLPQSSFAGAPR